MRYVSASLIAGAAILVTVLVPIAAPAGESVGNAAGLADTVAYTEVGEAVTGECLEAQTGGQDTTIDQLNAQLSTMRVNGQMAQNQLVSNVTGFNTVGTDAFGNASGIATVIQNSGNQVIINNAMILNLYVE
jgi:uncharacterized coiled-coil protein SlyX